MKWLIVEDQMVSTQGIKSIFQAEWPDVDLAFAENGIEALKKLDEDKFELMMTDLAMPHMGGLELITRVRQAKIDIKIVVFTIHNNLFHVRSCIDANVDAYLTKDDGFNQIKEAISLALQNETYRSERIKHHLSKTTMEAFNLTPIQLNIAILLSKGKSAKQISEIHNTGEEAIKSHRKHIYKSLNINHITDLTRWVEQKEAEYFDWRNGR